MNPRSRYTIRLIMHDHWRHANGWLKLDYIAIGRFDWGTAGAVERSTTATLMRLRDILTHELNHDGHLRSDASGPDHHPT